MDNQGMATTQVWVISEGDYEDREPIAVAATPVAAFEWAKRQKPAPNYEIDWSEPQVKDGWGLITYLVHRSPMGEVPGGYQAHYSLDLVEVVAT